MTNKKPIKTKHKINIEAFHCNKKQEEYKNLVSEKLHELKENNSIDSQENISSKFTVQETWSKIMEITTQSAKSVVGEKIKTRKHKSDTIKELSDKQKIIKQKIESAKSIELKESLKTQRNRVLT